MIHEVGFTPQEDGWSKLEKRLDKLNSPRSIEYYYHGIHAGRAIGEIAYEHGYTLVDFLAEVEGKRVLDLGAGYSSLDKQAKDLGAHTQIVGIDVPGAYFSFEDTEDEATIWVPRDDWWEGRRSGNEVIGFAQALPFANESFDMIISTFSMPIYADSTALIEGFLGEALRVLKPGGSFSMDASTIWGGSRYETAQTVEVYFLNKLKALHADPRYQVTLHSFIKDSETEFGVKREGVVIEKLDLAVE